MACSFEPGRWWKKQSLRVVEHYSLGKMQRFLKPHHLLTKRPAPAPAWLTAHHVHCVHHSAHSQHHRHYQFGSWHTWMEGALLSVLARSLEKECWPVPLFAHGMHFIYSLPGLPLLPPSLQTICCKSARFEVCPWEASACINLYTTPFFFGWGWWLRIANLYLQPNNTYLWQFWGDVINQAPFYGPWPLYTSFFWDHV